VKFLTRSKDGGPESTVDAYWLFEVKGLLSVALLRFGPGSRPVFHSHAFHSLNWLLRGKLFEHVLDPSKMLVEQVRHVPSLRPVMTWRHTLHQVVSKGTSWVLTIRGPWQEHWLEYLPVPGTFCALEHGRGVVAEGLTGSEAAWLLWLAPRDVAERLRGMS